MDCFHGFYPTRYVLESSRVCAQSQTNLRHGLIMCAKSKSNTSKRGRKPPAGRKVKRHKSIGKECLIRNVLLEKTSLEYHLIRLPGLRLHATFHYMVCEGEPFLVTSHDHPHWEISRVVSGEAEYTIENHGVTFRPGRDEYLIIPAGYPHHWELKRAPVVIHSWQVKIEPDTEEKESQHIFEGLQRKVRKNGYLFAASTPQIQSEASLWRLSGEIREPQAFALILSGVARVVLGDLLIRIKPWPSGFMRMVDDRRNRVTLLAERIKVYIDENLHTPLTMRELEGHFHYCAKHMNRIFKGVYACPIGQYIRNQRIEQAKHWLSTTDRSVKDIALSLGYRTPSPFCRFFLMSAGMTPLTYRQYANESRDEKLKRSIRLKMRKLQPLDKPY